MAMKQTQTKMFDFSDIGLDFSFGSKNLFPDRFKKMLALGYNVQTVTSVSVSGNQVTFTYGGTHGYVADRVLKVDSGELSIINGGEFVIDNVTENTVTMTIEEAPALIAGNFATKVAPLGYELVYEQPYVHIYKFKALDESDLFLRLCFQSALNLKNAIQPCVGKLADLQNGTILDSNSITGNASIEVPGSGFRWDFTSDPVATYNNYTYAQGLSRFGAARLVGSLYHLLILGSMGGSYRFIINGLLPTHTLSLTGLIDAPSVVIFGHTMLAINSSVGAYLPGSYSLAYVGSLRVNFSGSRVYEGNFKSYDLDGTQPYYSAVVEGFNTQPAEPLMIFEHSSKMLIGAAYGMYNIKLGSVADIGFALQSQPVETFDIDFQSKCLLHSISTRENSSFSSKLCIPIEEIKL